MSFRDDSAIIEHMGLLDQYKDQSLPARSAARSDQASGGDDGFIIQFTIRLSGGALDKKKANMVLVGFSVLLLAATAYFVIGGL